MFGYLNDKCSFGKMYGQIIIALILNCSLAILFSKSLWAKHPLISHTFLEIIPVIISLMIFSIIWYTYEFHSPAVHIISFSFLVIAILLFAHIVIFYDYLNWSYQNAMKFVLIARFIEVFVFLNITFNLIKIKIPKWWGLACSLIIAVIICWGILKFSEYALSPAFTINSYKIFVNLIAIILFLFVLYNLTKRRKKVVIISYSWIYMALLLGILTTLVFIFRDYNFEFTNTLAHTLRITFYYFFLRGIFVSSIIYPYRKLQENKSYITDILNELPIAVMTFDSDFELNFLNKKAGILLGHELEEIQGLSVDDVINKNLHISNRPLEIDKLIGDEHGNNIHEISFIDPQGDKIELLLHCAPIYDHRYKDEELVGIIGVASDITELKKEQKNIQQQEKLAVLGQMAAGIVHEVKNPLTAILGFSNLINKKTNDELITSYSNIIKQEANSLDKIVSDFLTFAKPQTPKLEKVSLNTIVEGLELLIRTTGCDKGIGVHFKLGQNLKDVFLDKNQIKQVILNIVNNAFDANTGIENSVLEVSTGYNRLTDHSYITIFNNGKTMTEEEKQKIATPFYTTKDKGTGLGLSISFQMVKEHKGIIEFESEEGLGTFFTISFPTYPVEEKDVSE